ncbi:MAG: recombinase family protein [Clostridiales bacterium]|nr:recombinase family protein [Clostridiales bacterium]
MKAAIYSRKSKYTGKGESVENQIKLCKEYGINNLNINEKDFFIYVDEGFSGSNTNRPKFQKMLVDIKEKKIDIIICYRLDRISRNVLDFLNLIEILNKENIAFVSIREQFDTTTPMGRAMMYITSIFAQLERETIAERIKDNMLELAKSGRWLGGNPPTGFRSIAIITREGKKECKLIPIEKEIVLVKEIYSKFLLYKSLTAVESYLLKNNIKTKNGKFFSRNSIKKILKNPIYSKADKEMLEYLNSKGYNIYAKPEDFNGENGIIAYNKTKQDGQSKKNICRDKNEWIIAVGKHEGVISGIEWVEAQNLLERNKSKDYKRSRNIFALLSGILKCKKCGSFMRPKSMQRYNKKGEKVFYYICKTKEKTKKSQCDNFNINGNVADKQVVESLKKLMTFFDINFIKDDIWESISIDKKRCFIRTIMPNILWDGKKIDIILDESLMFPFCKHCK